VRRNLRQLAWRALYLIGVLIAATILTSLLISLLPGNPAFTILGRGATPSAVARIDSSLHLNEPFFARYGDWLWGLLHGNFGTSYLTGKSVAGSLAQRIPVTLEEIALSQIIALVVSIPLGVWSAYRPGGKFDRAVTTGVFFFLAMPVFVLGILLTLALAVHVKVFPAGGFTPLSQNPWQNLHDLLLPALTLAAGALAGYVRVLRAEMISTLQQDYISVARSKGLSVGYILRKHAFRSSAFTLLTIVGLNIAGLIGGAVVVEQIFSIPGVGSYLVSSILQRDYIAVQGAVVVIAVAFVLVNFAVDVTYSLLDPRAARGRL
jgi:peptide/nickel transport system permease protein